MKLCFKLFHSAVCYSFACSPYFDLKGGSYSKSKCFEGKEKGREAVRKENDAVVAP